MTDLLLQMHTLICRLYAAAIPEIKAIIHHEIVTLTDNAQSQHRLMWLGINHHTLYMAEYDLHNNNQLLSMMYDCEITLMTNQYMALDYMTFFYNGLNCSV